MRQTRLLSQGSRYSRVRTSTGIFLCRLIRRFDEGELEALRANGEGELGGPPTTKSEGSGRCETTGELRARGAVLAGKDWKDRADSALLEVRDSRRDGMEDIVVVSQMMAVGQESGGGGDYIARRESGRDFIMLCKAMVVELNKARDCCQPRTSNKSECQHGPVPKALIHPIPQPFTCSVYSSPY
jgi:hypothetical protein